MADIEQVRHEFSAQELAELAQQLAGVNLRIDSWQQEKADIAAHLGALIKEHSSKARDLARKIQNKYELRDVEVSYVYDEPQEGWKRAIDVLTGQTVRECEMSREEQMQRRLDFEGRT